MTITKENMFEIITNLSIELKNRIESFIQNNINWNKVKEIGSLDYSKDIYTWTNKFKTNKYITI